MAKDGLVLANTVAIISAVLIGISVGGLFSHLDSRLVVTYTETFSGLKKLRDFLNITQTYNAGSNPLNVTHVQFPQNLQTLEEVEDYERRRLVSSAYVRSLNISNSIQPSILGQLMQDSWCSSGAPIPNTIPANRTPGCACIAKAYLDFVNSSLPAVYTNLTLVNVSEQVRKTFSEQLYRCWDLRLVTRSKSCGLTCTTHIAGLVLLANAILFLACASFLLSYYLDWNTYVIKGLIVLLGAIFITLFVARDPLANMTNVVCILVSLVLLVVVLHDELSAGFVSRNRDEDGVVRMPHPLMVCVFVLLPLILSTHAFQISVAIFGRDIWALVSFGICGGLFGILLQRYFWLSYYGSTDSEFVSILTKVSLMVSYTAVEVLMTLLFIAYYYGGSLGALSNVFVFAVYMVFLTTLAWLLAVDDRERKQDPSFFIVTETQNMIVLLVLASNFFMTIVCIIDLSNHPRPEWPI